MLAAKAEQRLNARPGDFEVIFRWPSMYSRNVEKKRKIWWQVKNSPEALDARRRGMRRACIVATHHTGSSLGREADTRQHVNVVFFNFGPWSIEEVVHIEVHL
ncbi:hypothetical protein PsYK624_091270 [Phanerochaete sordida]|uniref:Uncharacterized protein n=1 Tax=Phanerochaete sordida TaxID=48140 RepID=A0A9P3LFR7_9APHY|nr:hypothetical protein PsYK624_091270 [Phanerochaete sordida]